MQGPRSALVQIRARVSYRVCQQLERAASGARRKRDAQAGWLLDSWAAAYQAGQPVLEEVDDDDLIEIRCSVRPETRELLDQVAQRRQRRRSAQAGLILGEHFRRGGVPVP